jgi:hypothetical protein
MEVQQHAAADGQELGRGQACAGAGERHSRADQGIRLDVRPECRNSQIGVHPVEPLDQQKAEERNVPKVGICRGRRCVEAFHPFGAGCELYTSWPFSPSSDQKGCLQAVGPLGLTVPLVEQLLDHHLDDGRGRHGQNRAC